MTRFNFDPPVDDDDVLVIQGVEYPMQPVGLRAMRRMLTMNRQLQAPASNGDDVNVTEERLDAALELILFAVKPECRDALREHIEDRVPPRVLVQISRQVANSMSDLDPTEPGSSSPGSTPAGSPSTEPALPVASTPAL